MTEPQSTDLELTISKAGEVRFTICERHYEREGQFGPECVCCQVERLRSECEILAAQRNSLVCEIDRLRVESQSAFDRGYDKGHHDGALGIVPTPTPEPRDG